MSDLNFQDLSTVQSNQQPTPITLASATVIAPTTFLTKLTGSTALATITPPVTGCHMLAIVSVDGGIVVGTGGNILVGATTIVNRPSLFIWDPVLKKYYIVTTV